MLRKTIPAALALIAIISAPSVSMAANLSVKDASGATQQLCETTGSDGSLTPCLQALAATAALQQQQIAVLQSMLATLQAPVAPAGSPTAAGQASMLAAIQALLQPGGKIDPVYANPDTDVGVSIAAATATTLATLTSTTHGYTLQNNTSGACYWRVGAPATPDQHSRLLPANGYYETANLVGTGILSVYCPNAGSFPATTK